jgi:DNA-binding NtrC family response regulator
MRTILLVDDEFPILGVLREISSTLGYTVVPRPDAESALSVIREGIHIDLVITDYPMPGMNGVEFLMVLRQVLPSVPVIMLTEYCSVEIYLKLLGLGIFEHLNKPVRMKELYRVVKSALERSETGTALLTSQNSATRRFHGVQETNTPFLSSSDRDSREKRIVL